MIYLHLYTFISLTFLFASLTFKKIENRKKKKKKSQTCKVVLYFEEKKFETEIIIK